MESCDIVFNSLKGKIYSQEVLDDAKYALTLFGLSSNIHPRKGRSPSPTTLYAKGFNYKGSNSNKRH